MFREAERARDRIAKIPNDVAALDLAREPMTSRDIARGVWRAYRAMTRVTVRC